MKTQLQQRIRILQKQAGSLLAQINRRDDDGDHLMAASINYTLRHVRSQIRECQAQQRLDASEGGRK